MINRRSATWVIPLLFLITFPLWKIPVAAFLTPRGIDSEKETVTKKDNKDFQHDFIMDEVVILQSQSGKRTATIKAENAFTGEDSDTLSLQNVNADLNDKNDNITNVIADIGTYKIESKELILQNNVVVTRIEGQQKMVTDLLIYSDKEGTVISPGKTGFSGEGFQVVSGKMEYNVIDGSYRLSKRVNCILGKLEDS